MTVSNISRFERELDKANIKVKPLKIEVDKTRLRIRVRQKSKGLNFTKYTFDATLEGLNATVAICQDILTDYYRGCFDSTLVKYGLATVDTPKLTEVINLPVPDNSEPTLDVIWSTYKELKSNTCNKTKKGIWKPIDQWLSQCPKECLILSNADKLLAWLRLKYKDTTLLPKFKVLSASVELSIKLGKNISNNPFPSLKSLLILPPKKQIKAFSKQEIKIIIESFKTARFDSDKATLKNDYYAGLIEFRFLTGCRPSEAIALTWDDIKDNGDKMQIIFDKRYSEGEILTGTKNGVDARIFPCNKQLTEFIRQLPKISNEHNLVFPARRGGYINVNNISGRTWSRYIHKLVELGLVKEYLPFYDERHTYTTHVARSGHDLASISSVVGNSVKTLITNYLAVNDDIELPEI